MSLRTRRGFTLAELMVVVAIIGILAALAIYGVRKYVTAAGAGEAQSMLNNMKIAQASFRSENLTYAGCRTASATPNANTGAAWAAADMYPRIPTDLNDKKFQWVTVPGTVNVADCFGTIGFRASGPTVFSYGVLAGLPTNAAVNLSGSPFPSGTQTPGVGVPREPWYIATAMGNRDSNTTYALLSTTSVSDRVQVLNDTE